MIKILKFLNLLDDSGSLSITNLAVYIALIKISVSTTAPVDAAVLFTAVLNYGHKRFVNNQNQGTDGN